MSVTDSSHSTTSTEDTGDLESALAAIQRRDPSGPIARPPCVPPERSARSNRRAALGLALVFLLVAGLVQVLTATPDQRDEPSNDTRAAVVFGNAQAGSCLGWPPDAPDSPSFVQCREEHMFEVAKSVDMTNFGEPCQAAVRSYLGTRYDPNSRFTIGVLWAGDAQGKRNLLCGLQLLGLDGKPTAFKGSVAELDQSKVWLPGTCLGIDTAAQRSTDIPVDCASEHAVEVTGSVGLAERFQGGPPPEPEQEAFIRDACTRLTEGYLAPVPLQATGLALNYTTLAPTSWTAGSRQVSCGIVSYGDQGLRPLVGSVRGRSPGDQAPPPPPPPPPAPEPTPPPEPASSTTTTTAEATTTAPVPPPPPPTSQAPAPTTAAPAPSASTTASSTVPTSPALGPPPGPAPGEPLPEETPQPGVILVPGLPPITLPGFAPPPPAPPPAP